MSNKEIDQVLEGPIVAVQYPATVALPHDESKAVELKEKYKHLVSISPDDKEAYEELKLAISDVRKHRIENDKQEDVIKKPLNKFRSLVISTAKKIRESFTETEDRLNLIKDRVDEVLADREAAKQKVFDDAYESFSKVKCIYLGSKSIEEIESYINSLDNEVMSIDRFGHRLNDALSLLESSMQIASNSLNDKKEQIKFEEEKAAFEKQQKEAEEQKARDDAEKAEMAAKIAKFEAESKPLISDHKDEHEIKLDNGSTIKYKDVPGSSGMVGFDKASSPHDESVTSFVETKSSEEMETIHDGTALCVFIQALGRANNMRVISKSQEQNEAVNRVKETLVKAIGYLEKFDV